MTAPQSASRQPKQLDAGSFQPEISSFRCTWPPRARPPRRCGPTPRRCSGSPPRTCCGQAARTRLGAGHAGRTCSSGWYGCWTGTAAAYASNQYRALQQFFKWLAAEEEIPDPMAGLKPPHVPDKPVPVFADAGPAAAGARLRGPVVRAAPRRGGHRGVQGDRDPAVRARPASGTSPDDPQRSDVDLWHRGDHRPRQGPQDPDGQDRATTPPAPWTGTSASAPGTRRHTGRSCGSGSTTGGR